MTQTPNPAPPAPPPDTVTLTIDGRSVTAKKGTLLVEAARQVGIEIPVFCYHPKLKPVGACRMCLVQIEKLPRLQTACTTPVAAEMVVSTVSPEVVAAQNGVIELLLANHPLDCPICDKGGECPLQDNTFNFGLGVSRFTEEKRHKEKAYPLSNRIVLDRERCIMCYRCVRFHQEIPGDEALAAVFRGAEAEIGTLPGESYDSIFSGNTIELCPVGALTSRAYRFKARPWDLVRTPSVCSGCAVGCSLEVHSRTERVLRLISRENPAVDGGWLCDVGRFDTIPAPPEQRVARPMVRGADGRLAPTTWQAAVERARDLLGGMAGILASPSLSNEALWLVERFFAAPSSGAGKAFPVALWPAERSISPWPVQGAIENLARCKTIVLAGLDAWNELPILALWIHRAVTIGGAKLVAINAANGQFRDTAHWLRAPLAWETQTVQALTDAIGGGTPTDVDTVSGAEIAAAAKALGGGSGPAALLAGPRLAATREGRDALEALARAIGAKGSDGLVGAPGLAANARGAHELAPTVAGGDARAILSSAASGASTLLLLGDEAWGELNTGQARLIVAGTRLVDDPRIDVLLPMAHPYERQGSITNLEGRLQLQEGGASPPLHARADWGVVAKLAQALGLNVPGRLDTIRQAIAERDPALAPALRISEIPPGKPEHGWQGTSSGSAQGQGQMPVTGSAQQTGNRGA